MGKPNNIYSEARFLSFQAAKYYLRRILRFKDCLLRIGRDLGQRCFAMCSMTISTAFSMTRRARLLLPLETLSRFRAVGEYISKSTFRRASVSGLDDAQAVNIFSIRSLELLIEQG